MSAPNRVPLPAPSNRTLPSPPCRVRVIYEAFFCSSTVTPSPQADIVRSILFGNGTVSYFYLCSLTEEILQEKNRQQVQFSPDRDRHIAVRPFFYNQVDQTNGSWIAFPENDQFVERLHSPSPFIAMCAPLPPQFDSFMNMLERYNCQILVTLTDPKEDGMIKADIYLPKDEGMMIMKDNHALDYLKTQTLATLENGWTLISSEYQLQLLNRKNPLHFENLHVSNWKDGTEGTPRSVLEVVMTIYMHKKKIGSKAPIVMHCSMGLGRTGVIIGCYQIFQKAVEEGKIMTDQEIFKIAVQMRLQRYGLGGAEKQYRMLYQFRDLLATLPELSQQFK